MTRFVQIVLVPVLLAAAGPWAAAAENNAEQEEAIAAIKKMGGFVDTDPQQLEGNPVIRVHLHAHADRRPASAWRRSRNYPKSSGSACTPAILPRPIWSISRV